MLCFLRIIKVSCLGNIKIDMQYHNPKSELSLRESFMNLFNIRPAYTLFLKTGTVCNAGCVTCPAGRKLPEDKESSGNMTPEMMERILCYVKTQGRIISATHHYYNEPTINSHIHQLIATCHQHGVHCLMSTNGSFWSKLEQVLNEGLTNLIFSVSGWTQETHEKSHKNVDIEKVKRNMRLTSEFVNSRKDFFGEKMFVRVSWHDYVYNRHERAQMRRFSEELGFTFTSYNTGVLPLERAQVRMLQTLSDPNSKEDIAERDVRTKLKEAQTLCLERKHWRCINQDRMITIDSDGYLYNCCVKAHDANKRSLLFDTDLEQFNKFRLEEDTDCAKCKEHGHHVYAMQQYRTPLGFKTEVKKQAENVWRRLGLGGIFPSVSAKRSQFTYSRPQKELV